MNYFSSFPFPSHNNTTVLIRIDLCGPSHNNAAVLICIDLCGYSDQTCFCFKNHRNNNS